ncbi:methyltransferase domain-containing protein [Colletotrichum karsti]|uniref:Methyltransferase domain-containing protein n=1 Tax=Colletotrichum karsti TaxID=1095194 RepID=A0A9P6LF60_9PEZI|nr:methyltransferase domain-containing protein [Colletotrichum karsti]KAF9871153.1 methyltransferase domain-containing protein [Colletotrichum karsti]
MADMSETPASSAAPVDAKAGSGPLRSNTASPAKSKTASPTEAESSEPTSAQAGIEVDDTVADNDSVLDDQLSISAYTASLTSSVVNYPTEHGRRYHAFRSGAYYGPNDESELDRLDFMSAFLIKAVGGKLHHAPLEKDKIHRILDIGTGTGIWAVQIAELFPNAEVIGNDLSPIQTNWVPPNVKFEVDDVESPWVGSKYDFIFSRSMAGAIKDWPKLVESTFQNTNPGGWVEFQDWDLLYRSDDGSLTDDHQTLKMTKMFIDICRQIGREPCPGPLLPRWLEDAGFTNIVHRKVKIPLGSWAKEPHLKEIGQMNLVQVLDGLEAFNLRLFTGSLGWTKEEAMVLFAQCRNEMKSKVFHALIEFHVVYAQKPEAEVEE